MWLTQCGLALAVTLVNIGSVNDLLPVWHQAITWSKADLLLVQPLGTKQNKEKVDQENEFENYHITSNISRTSVGNKTVGHSDVVGASPVGAAPTTSSFPT